MWSYNKRIMGMFVLKWLLIPCTFVHLTQADIPDKTKTLNLGMLLPWSDEWILGPYMGAAAGLGVKEVIRRQLIPGVNISWQWADTHCKARLGLKAALDLWELAPVLHAYIGGGCSVVCKPVALIAAAWDIPYVSFGCTSNELSQKFEYPTFSRYVILCQSKLFAHCPSIDISHMYGLAIENSALNSKCYEANQTIAIYTYPPTYPP